MKTSKKISGTLLKDTNYKQQLKRLDSGLSKQLDNFFDVLTERWSNYLGEEEAKPRLEWTRSYIEWKVISRIIRAGEVVDPRVDQARELARQVIGRNKHHFFVTCLDGRNLPVIMFSHVPRLGGVVRTQAGELFNFETGLKPGTVNTVKHDSFETESIRELVTNPDQTGHVIFYSLDSHIGCAARAGLHEVAGGQGKDGGLQEDILRKMVVARGLTEYAETLQTNSSTELATIVPQLFSYDPHDGTLYMGLEAYAAKLNKSGFTSHVMEKLSKEHRIVRTWDFLKDKEVVSELKKHVKPADFRNRFAESLLDNWQSISHIFEGGEGRVYRKIYRRLHNAYELADYSIGSEEDIEKRKVSYEGLENKAKVMLKNLVTRWSIAQNEHEWPFGEHVEQGVVITEGGYGPFPTNSGSIAPDTFAIFSKEDVPYLLDHTKLAIKLVRSFRAAGKIKDPVATLAGEAFKASPVVVLNHAILNSATPETWEILRSINFAKLFSEHIDWNRSSDVYNWTKVNTDQLLMQQLGDHKFLAKELAEIKVEVYKLFDRMRAMMDDREFRSWIIHGNILIVNKLIDSNRRPMVFAPMIV